MVLLQQDQFFLYSGTIPEKNTIIDARTYAFARIIRTIPVYRVFTFCLSLPCTLYINMLTSDVLTKPYWITAFETTGFG